MPEPVVFWDIDGTIVRPSMERLFVRYLRQSKLLRLWQLPINTIKLLPSSLGQYHRIKLAYLHKRPKEQVNEWMDDCFNKIISPRLLLPCLDAIKQLNDAGMTNVLLSGTLYGLAERLATQTDITEIIAAIPEIIAGKYTGRLTEPHPFARRKAEFAEKWLQKNNRNWSQVIVIADHWRDRFLLKKAALPIVINPAEGMRKFAQTEGWIVLSERDRTLRAEQICRPIMELALPE